MTWTQPALALPLTLAEALMLVAFWKALIFLLFFGAWAWVVSTVYDKHAARFFLPRERWGLFHVLMGLVALLGAYLMPVEGEIGFVLGLVLMIVLLAADLFVYAAVVNKDERVPETHKIRLDAWQKLREANKAKAASKNLAQVKLTIRTPDKQTVPAPLKETPEYEVRTAAESVYLRAIDARASQVDLLPKDQGSYNAAMLIDAVRKNADALPAPLALKVMDFWKGAARLDVNDRRRKLTGDCVVEMGSAKRTVRVSSIGVQGGMRLTLLFNPEQAVKRKPEDLGLLDGQLEALRELVAQGKGLVLLGGVADGGRTTTFYTVTAMHDAYTQTVQTLEVEQQGTLEGIRQQVFDQSVDGAEFATTLRSLLRRDPDVVAVAEVPDTETAKEITKADFTRTRIYAGLSGDSAMGVIEKWVSRVGDPSAAARGLQGVLVGRLMRKLCVNCRVEYPPSAEMLKKLGVGEGKVAKLYKKGGQVLIKNKPEVCPVCAGDGYVGLEGIFEFYPINDEIRDLIATGNLPAVKAALRKQQLPTVQQAAIRKALTGVTSVEEVMRVTAGATGGGGGGGEKPA